MSNFKYNEEDQRYRLNKIISRCFSIEKVDIFDQHFGKKILRCDVGELTEKLSENNIAHHFERKEEGNFDVK